MTDEEVLKALETACGLKRHELEGISERIQEIQEADILEDGEQWKLAILLQQIELEKLDLELSKMADLLSDLRKLRSA